MIWVLQNEQFATPLVGQSTENNTVQVTIADVPLVKKHRLMTEQELDRLCFKKDGSTWYLTNEVLGAVAMPDNNCTDPEDHVRWVPNRTARKDIKFYNDKMDEFFDNMVQRGLVKTRSAAQFMYLQMCDLMLQWLLANRKLNLGFCDISALPYRVNWRESLLHLDLLYWKNKAYKLPTMRKNAVSARIKPLLYNANLFSVAPKTRFVRWHLFIKPKAAWNTSATMRELERRKRPFYYSETIDKLRSKIDEIIAFYITYLAEVRTPKAAIPYCFPEKRMEGMQKPEEVVFQDVSEIPTLPATTLSLGLEKEPCVALDIHEEAEGVQNLRHIPAPRWYMRENRIRMARRREPETTTFPT